MTMVMKHRYVTDNWILDKSTGTLTLMFLCPVCYGNNVQDIQADPIECQSTPFQAECTCECCGADLIMIQKKKYGYYT